MATQCLADSMGAAAIVIVGGTPEFWCPASSVPLDVASTATAGAAGTTLAVFGTLGLHAANVYYVGRYPQRRTALVWNSVVVALVVAFVAAGHLMPFSIVSCRQHYPCARIARPRGIELGSFRARICHIAAITVSCR